MIRSMITAAAATAACAPVMAQAADTVHLASDVFVERFMPASNGRTARILERAGQLRPGDRVVFVVNWKADRGRQFTLTNPMPPAVSFQGSAQGTRKCQSMADATGASSTC